MMTTRTSRMLNVLVGAICMALAIIAYNMFGKNEDASPGSSPEVTTRSADGTRNLRDGVIEFTPPGTVCEGGTSVKSDSDLARADQYFLVEGVQCDRAWLCGIRPAFMYGEVELSTRTDGDARTAPGMWSSLAEQDGGSVTEVQGIPAYLHPGDPEEEVYPMIRFNVGAEQVTLLGTLRADAEDLMDLAKRLDLKHLHGTAENLS